STIVTRWPHSTPAPTSRRKSYEVEEAADSRKEVLSTFGKPQRQRTSRSSFSYPVMFALSLHPCIRSLPRVLLLMKLGANCRSFIRPWRMHWGHLGNKKSVFGDGPDAVN